MAPIRYRAITTAGPNAAAAAAAAGSKDSAQPATPPPPPGYYQRPLPSHLISFASNAGRAIFAEALEAGGMEGYFALAQQFQTQSEPAYCGPTTLSMILNALGLDPNRIWKGSWRWFSEEMLIDRTRSAPPEVVATLFTETIRTTTTSATATATATATNSTVSGARLAKIDSEGLSFEEFLFLAECNGARIQGIYAGDATEEGFRSAILAATSRTDLHCVVSFARHVLGQTGSGHYSPIGGYHAARDLVLILDVARFKYPPYWVPVSLLWRAMLELDPSTQRPRGYYLMSRGPSLHTSYPPLLSSCQIAVDKASWSALAEHFCVVLPPRLAALPANTSASVREADPKAVFAEILASLPVEVTSVFTMYTHDLSARQHEQHLHATRTAAYYNHIAPRASDSSSAAAVAAHTTTTAAPTATATRSGEYKLSVAGPLPSLDSLPPLPGSATATATATASASAAVRSEQQRRLSLALPSSASHDWTSPLPASLVEELTRTELFRLIMTLYPASTQQSAQKSAAQSAQQSAAASPCAGTAANGPNGAGAGAGAGAVDGSVFRLKEKYSIAGAVTHTSSLTAKCVELQLATLLLLACPQQVFSLLKPELRTAIDAVRNISQLTNVSPSLRQEVAALRSQMGILADYCLCSYQHQQHTHPHQHTAPDADDADAAPVCSAATATAGSAGTGTRKSATATAAAAPNRVPPLGFATATTATATTASCVASTTASTTATIVTASIEQTHTTTRRASTAAPARRHHRFADRPPSPSPNRRKA